ncbi:MAG: hypothetical protein A2W95_06315 [Bacteroidetes bacterium GWA2_40_14]|nr:MAG: hypothetical protein A2W95_06315 [Bacteroidetes bacterium GWA2_40_14]
MIVSLHIKKVFLWLSLMCLLTFIFQPIHAQEKPSELISASFSDASLVEVFQLLEAKTGRHFYYQAEWLKNYAFTGSFTQKKIEGVVDNVLDKTGLMSITIEGNFYIVPREQVARHLKKMNNLFGRNGDEGIKDYILIGKASDIGKYSKNRVTGKVTDGANGEPLVGATIQVMNTNYYGVSGYSGTFMLEVPAGSYELKISSVGYENQVLQVKVLGPGTLDVELFEESHALNEVTILSEKVDRNVTRDQMSIIELDAKSIKQLPSMIGERDIIKSFTTMPGVKSVGEFGAGINVRGGGEDQNLYLLENCPIFNTSHVMGLLSAVNPDAVTSVTLYKGHIPAEYGERVSSVMDISFNGHNVTKFKGTGGIGIYSSRLSFETPLLDKKFSLKVGGRTSYSDYLLTKMPDYNLQNSAASFYDVNAMLSFHWKNNPLSIYAYRSYDYFKYAGDFSYKYGNRLASLNWQHIFNPSFNTSLTAAYSSYNLANTKTGEALKASEIQSDLTYLSGKFMAEYTGFSDQTITGGIQVIQYRINPGERQPVGTSQIEPLKIQNELGNEYSFFINDVIRLGAKLSFQAGLRYTLFQNVGPQTINTYLDGNTGNDTLGSIQFGAGDLVQKYQGFEPRASIKYLLNESSSLKMSYNRNKQYLSLLSYTSISTPEDVWKLSDPYIKPIIADQLAIGYYKNLLNNLVETSVELYYKKMQNLTDYRNGAQLELNDNVETELLSASGQNYGIEMMIKKVQGKFNGTLSYTYARAFKQTHGSNFNDKINNNKEYPSQYDVPNNVNLNLNYQFNRRVRFGVTFTYASGRPFTQPEYIYYLEQNQLVFFSDRNKYRLPDYHRLDVSLSIDESLKKRKKWKGSWNFSVLNVYGRDNAYSIIYRRDTPTPENDYQVFSMYKMYLIGIPFPTVTYNFVF